MFVKQVSAVVLLMCVKNIPEENIRYQALRSRPMRLYTCRSSFQRHTIINFSAHKTTYTFVAVCILLITPKQVRYTTTKRLQQYIFFCFEQRYIDYKRLSLLTFQFWDDCVPWTFLLKFDNISWILTSLDSFQAFTFFALASIRFYISRSKSDALTLYARVDIIFIGWGITYLIQG